MDKELDFTVGCEVFVDTRHSTWISKVLRLTAKMVIIEAPNGGEATNRYRRQTGRVVGDADYYPASIRLATQADKDKINNLAKRREQVHEIDLACSVVRLNALNNAEVNRIHKALKDAGII